jgi:hypothetical protein
VALAAIPLARPFISRKPTHELVFYREPIAFLVESDSHQPTVPLFATLSTSKALVPVAASQTQQGDSSLGSNQKQVFPSFSRSAQKQTQSLQTSQGNSLSSGSSVIQERQNQEFQGSLTTVTPSADQESNSHVQTGALNIDDFTRDTTPSTVETYLDAAKEVLKDESDFLPLVKLGEKYKAKVAAQNNLTQKLVGYKTQEEKFLEANQQVPINLKKKISSVDKKLVKTIESAANAKKKLQLETSLAVERQKLREAGMVESTVLQKMGNRLLSCFVAGPGVNQQKKAIIVADLRSKQDFPPAVKNLAKRCAYDAQQNPTIVDNNANLIFTALPETDLQAVVNSLNYFAALCDKPDLKLGGKATQEILYNPNLLYTVSNFKGITKNGQKISFRRACFVAMTASANWQSAHGINYREIRFSSDCANLDVHHEVHNADAGASLIYNAWVFSEASHGIAHARDELHNIIFKGVGGSAQNRSVFTQKMKLYYEYFNKDKSVQEPVVPEIFESVLAPDDVDYDPED